MSEPVTSKELATMLRDMAKRETAHETWFDALDAELCRAAADALDRSAHEPETGHWYSGEDIDVLVRELDVWLNGEEGAAKQAKLCDVVAQITRRTQPPGADELLREIRAAHAQLQHRRAGRDDPPPCQCKFCSTATKGPDHA